MQELFASPFMRINNTSDVIGVEICGALKNVLAIAAGIVEGLHLGNNAMAALVTQVLAEVKFQQLSELSWRRLRPGSHHMTHYPKIVFATLRHWKNVLTSAHVLQAEARSGWAY